MPVTLPAHPAAILPLRRHLPALPLCALVIGSMTPDLAYAVGMYGQLSHSFAGLVLFCLPAGLAFFLWTEWLLLPLLRRTLPTVSGVELARFARSQGTPRTVAGWGWVVLAILLGAITHLLWDGFTHRQRWPANVLVHALSVQLQTEICGTLQLVCSVLGSVIVLRAMAAAYPSLPAASEPPRPTLLWLWLVPTVAAFLAAFAWRSTHVRAPGVQLHLWFMFWAGVGGALVVITLAAALFRWQLAPDRLLHPAHPTTEEG